MPAHRDAALDHAIDQAARHLASEAEAAVNDHPDADDLVAYQEGRLAGDDAERVRRHLVACPQCARDVLELEDFRLDEPADPALLPSPEETAEDWADFQRRVAPEPPAVEVRTGGPSWWALAAAVVVTFGVGFWIGVLTLHSARPLAAPAPTLVASHPLFLDLIPDGEALSRDAAPEVPLPATVDQLLLRLNLGDQTPHEAYRAEIFDAAGAIVWSQSALRRQPGGQFIVTVPRGELPPGNYRLELTGTTAGEETLLAIYPLVLSDAPDP